MNQEHELLPAIRAWLAATSDLEPPLGLSRENARRCARELLALIADGKPVPTMVEVGGELMDTLWAALEELNGEPESLSTLHVCDGLYQLIESLPARDDPSNEISEVLHCLAQIGWRSSPGGLAITLKARATIWEHGDERYHQEACQSGERVLESIESLRDLSELGVADVRRICAQIFSLAGIHPTHAVSSAAALFDLLERSHPFGFLDDREYLKGAVAYCSGVAGRQASQWDKAETWLAAAESAFGRTADRTDEERVEVERFALQSNRGFYLAVVNWASDRSKTLAIPRERLKSQLMLASALLSLGRTRESLAVLRNAQRDPLAKTEPALQAFLLIKMGTCLSYIGDGAGAMASFQTASAVLARFYYPAQSADLMASIGEHLGRLGRLEEALTIYRSAREIYRKAEQTSFAVYISVLIAELLVLLERSEEAAGELIVALPLIDQLDLRREGLAAVSLLRESVVKRRVELKTVQSLQEHIRKTIRP